MQRRNINAADAPAPAGQYTQAVEVTGASRTLYLSGQVGSVSARATGPFSGGIGLTMWMPTRRCGTNAVYRVRLGRRFGTE